MAKMTSEVAQLTEALLSLIPDAPKGPTAEQKERRRKQKAIKAATFKTKRFAHYIVGAEGAYAGGRLYLAGELIRLPIDADPSCTWSAVDKEGVALAEIEAARKAQELEESAGTAAGDDALDADELAADAARAKELAGEEEPEEEPGEKPAKAAKPVKKAAKPTKRGSRASDQDVA